MGGGEGGESLAVALAATWNRVVGSGMGGWVEGCVGREARINS